MKFSPTITWFSAGRRSPRQIDFYFSHKSWLNYCLFLPSSSTQLINSEQNKRHIGIDIRVDRYLHETITDSATVDWLTASRIRIKRIVCFCFVFSTNPAASESEVGGGVGSVGILAWTGLIEIRLVSRGSWWCRSLVLGAKVRKGYQESCPISIIGSIRLAIGFFFFFLFNYVVDNQGLGQITFFCRLIIKNLLQVWLKKS